MARWPGRLLMEWSWRRDLNPRPPDYKTKQMDIVFISMHFDGDSRRSWVHNEALDCGVSVQDAVQDGEE